MAVIRLALMVSFFLIAASASAVPHVFSPGQQAKAEEVNENFSSLEARILALENAQQPPVTSPSPTPSPTPSPPPTGQSYYAYVEGGVLKSADAVNGTANSLASSYKLVDANDITLRYINSGSLDLPKDFVIFDYDTEPTQSRAQNPSNFGENVVIQFTAAADGSINYSPASFTQYYESTDCTGQKYLDGNDLRPNGTVYNLDGVWVRLPLIDLSATNVGITAKSKTNSGDSSSCLEANELVPQAVIPISYDPEPILLKIGAPVSVVAP
jgi:hypothetical protein